MHELVELVAAWRGLDRRRTVLATLVKVEGSSYRRPGARMLLGTAESGIGVGVISAGCLERDLAARVEAVLSSGQPELVVYDGSTDDELIWGMGMGCRGILHVLLEPATSSGVEFTFQVLEEVLATMSPRRLVTVYQGPRCGERWTDAREPVDGSMEEQIEPPLQLTIFGTGADAVLVAEAAQSCGLQVTLCGVGEQRGWSGPRVDMISAAEGALPLPEGGALVVMSHHFHNDLAVLGRARASSLSYIGCLGPRHRYTAMLEQSGWGDDPRVFSPVGLDIAARTPREIATAIVAEVLAVLRGRQGGPLRERLAQENDFALHELGVAAAS